MIGTPYPYPKMKDSGIPWLGEVPEHWRLPRLGALLRERGETNGDGQVSEVLSVLRERGVIPYAEKGNIGNKKSEDITRYKVVKPDDIVVNCMNVIIGSVGLSRYTGCLSPVYYVLTRRSEHDHPRYLNAYFQTKPFQESLVRIGNGILAHRMRIPMELLKCEPFPLPPPPEQAAIVRYLDHVDRRIRRYIRAKQKLIKLLEEQKQALIHQIVTRGLDPNVRLKPSGVEWLGDVPEHWAEAIKIKYVSSLKGRLGWQGLKAGEYTSEGPYIVSSAHFRNHKINWEICPHVTQERYKLDKHIQLARGDILLMKDGAAMGKLAFVDELPGLACLNSHLLLFRPLAKNGEITYLSQFMFYYMQTECFQSYVQVNGTGATFLGISQESIGNHTVRLPPISEQTAVVEYLNHETADLDTATASANRQIDLLREYRTRLIADVGTGKLDVRSAAVRLPDEIKEPEPLDQADPLIDGEEEFIEDTTTPEEAAV